MCIRDSWKAIDAGFDAYHKVEVPADWANATDDKAPEQLHGNAATVDMVRSIMAVSYTHLRPGSPSAPTRAARPSAGACWTYLLYTSRCV